MTNVDWATVDDVTTPTNHNAANVDEGPCIVDSQQLLATSVFNGDDEYSVEKVIPVEANVVLVSRPGDVPQAASVELQDDHSVGNTDNSRLLAGAMDDDNANGISCQSTRAPRRHRKRSSLCNNVDADDVVIDVQSDVLTTGRKTSVPHQRHADASDREHRSKRKGNFSMILVNKDIIVDDYYAHFQFMFC